MFIKQHHCEAMEHGTDIKMVPNCSYKCPASKSERINQIGAWKVTFFMHLVSEVTE